MDGGVSQTMSQTTVSAHTNQAHDAPAVLIAAHGSRDPQGVADCHDVVARVRRLLPGITVSVAFVELAEPGIEDELRRMLAEQAAQAPELTPRVVVVPLMLGSGGHVRQDIPEFIAAAQASVPGSQVKYARPLGADPRLLSAVQQRIEAAAAGDGDLAQAWDLRDVSVVFLGRGALVAEANAQTAAQARLMYERTRAAAVFPAYIQVTRPSLPEALGQAAALGAQRIIVAPHFLLSGLLRTWTREQVEAWAQANPQVSVRVAEVIGDCDELAAVIIDRYREAAGGVDSADSAEGPGAGPADAAGESPEQLPSQGAPVYLSGLRLAGREVLVVGGGHVADRRVPVLLDAGAKVRLVSPTISVRLRRLLATTDSLDWQQRGFAAGDVAGAWYVLASTNDPAVNAQVAAEAEAAQVFCVRADAARGGTAWTPATTTSGGLTVAVIGGRDPRRSVRVRDAVVQAIHG